MKYKDRAEQRHVCETMSALLLPLMPFLEEETQERVKIGLRIINNIEIEEQEE